jgi:hypothetical protein
MAGIQERVDHPDRLRLAARGIRRVAEHIAPKHARETLSPDRPIDTYSTITHPPAHLARVTAKSPSCFVQSTGTQPPRQSGRGLLGHVFNELRARTDRTAAPASTTKADSSDEGASQIIRGFSRGSTRCEDERERLDHIVFNPTVCKPIRSSLQTTPAGRTSSGERLAANVWSVSEFGIRSLDLLGLTNGGQPAQVPFRCETDDVGLSNLRSVLSTL